MEKFSMPAILDRILHLPSQTHILLRYIDKTPKYVVMVSLQAILFIKKMFWYNFESIKSIKQK